VYVIAFVKRLMLRSQVRQLRDDLRTVDGLIAHLPQLERDWKEEREILQQRLRAAERTQAGMAVHA
jgi:hypothetical protein